VRRVLPLLAALLACAVPAAAQQPQRPRLDVVTVGSGPLSGTYYPVARAICRVVNRELSARNIRCSPEPTFGSVYNVQMMQAGELDFALVQADVQHQALNGAGEWVGRPFRGLRSVFAVYDEAFVVVGAAAAGIRGIEDLRGRRVATGVPGSGTRATWDALVGALGWQNAGRGRSAEATDIAAALCAGTLDAAVAVGFQPIAAVRAELAACGNALVPVSGAAVQRLTAAHPYFRPTTIPAAVYGTAADIETFGVSSDFVAAARTDPEIVAAVTRALLDNVEELARRSPALARLDRRRLVGAHLVAPLHPAAEAVYREAGLLP
jgi:uncharacterized protein